MSLLISVNGMILINDYIIALEYKKGRLYENVNENVPIVPATGTKI